VTFKLSPGIRGPKPTHSDYRCVDENNCDHEVYFLCGQANGGGVDYLTCMDAQPKMPNAEKAAKTCAAQNTPALDFSKISSCFSGAQGTALKAAAATYFDKKFPGPVGVPHIEINGVAQTDRTESVLLSKLCATGIKAPACTKVIVV
jgi:hypothetical protein